jgi:hypothetical protein
MVWFWPVNSVISRTVVAISSSPRAFGAPLPISFPSAVFTRDPGSSARYRVDLLPLPFRPSAPQQYQISVAADRSFDAIQHHDLEPIWIDSSNST